jgi:tRNA A37 threonylcarbamoyladenosine synthetase subunit TsaC/SUA5/YrdC
VVPHLDLDPPTAALATWIATVHRATLLVPIEPGAPPWLRENAPAGVVGVTMAWLPELGTLAEEFGYLAVSSGNLTGDAPVATAADADRIFGGEHLVLDGDAFRDPGVAHASAAMIEVRRGGALRVVRDGVNNRSEPDHSAYLDGLRARFDASEAGPA